MIGSVRKTEIFMKEDYYHTKESVGEYNKMAKGVNGQELIDQFVKILPVNSHYWK